MTLRLAAVALAGAALAAGCSAGGDDDAAPAATTVTVTETRGGGGGGDGVGFDEIPELVDRVETSVVSVVTDTGEGSGVVWDADGVIVTNHHVVAGAGSVQVVLASGAELPAEVEASTDDYDLAVLRVRRRGLPAATFTDRLPEVGELAVAVGNPLGFEQSVTAGIVSGLSRSIPSGGQTPALVDLIQTDAAISPGNSGGALVNGEGEVIGVNVAYVPPEQGAVALGFAIPAPTVRHVVTQLLERGRVEQAYLGILNPGTVTPELAQQFGLGADEGVAFVAVAEGGPAARAGLQPGDVIVAMDGRELRAVEDLFTELRHRRPGERVQLTVVRGGRRRQLAVTLGENPSS